MGLGGNLPSRMGMREIPLRDIIPQTDHLNKILHLTEIVRKLQYMYIACEGVMNQNEWEEWGRETIEYIRSLKKTKNSVNLVRRLGEYNGVYYFDRCKGKRREKIANIYIKCNYSLLLFIGMFKKSYDTTGKRQRCERCSHGRYLVIQWKKRMLYEYNNNNCYMDIPPKYHHPPPILKPHPTILDCPGIFPPDDISSRNTYERLSWMHSKTVEIFDTIHSQRCSSKLKKEII